MKTSSFKLLMATIASFIAVQTGYAQYNHSYTGGDGKSIDIVDASSGGTTYSCVLGQGASYPIILKKLDFFGNVMFDVGVDFSFTPLDIRPAKLLHTANDEYIVVGIAMNANVYNPFAARFDATGALLWFNEYNSNPGPMVMPNNGSRGMVNICEVQDDPTVESYIVTATGTDPFRTGGSGLDEFINALRIDGTGNLMWNKKYIPPIPFNTNLDDIRETPEALVFMNPADGPSRYYIGGSTTKLLSGPGSGYKGFFMSIDNMGNIADQYQDVNMPNPRHHVAIFDNTNDELVFSYTCSNAFVSGTSGSAIGLTRLSTAVGLSIIGSNYYIANNANETAGIWLTQNAAKTEYVIACDIYLPSPAAVPGAMGILTVNKGTFAPVVFDMYNYQRESHSAAIIDLVDGATENYVLAGTPAPGAGGLNQMRVISTNTLGTACGYHPIGYKRDIYGYATTTYLYSLHPEMSQFSFTPNQNLLDRRFTDCIFSPNSDQYKTGSTGIAAVNEANNLSVYPTLLQTETEVAIDLYSDNSGAANVLLTGIDGKKILSKSFEAQAGENHVVLDMNKLNSGTYIINIAGPGKSVNKSVKVSKL